jgi:hypothetical protein
LSGLLSNLQSSKKHFVALSQTTFFVEEVAAFLRPWQLELVSSIPMPPLPFPSFYFADQKLIVHCIPLRQFSEEITPTVFADLSEKYATQGIKIIHLWEDVWRSKKEIVQSRLRATLGESQRIPARLTKVRRIDKPTLDAFIEANHLQVSTTAKYKYGLFLPKQYERILNKENALIQPLIESLAQSQEVLVAVASFSGGKNILRDGQLYRSFELIRFANLVNCTVVGGLDKLLKAFTKEFHPDDMMTYADRDWSDGRSYERLGFERVGATPPQVFYVNSLTFERYYAERLQVPAIPPEWIKIYNAGNWKFLKKWK